MPPKNNQPDFIDDHIGFLYNSVVFKTNTSRIDNVLSESMVIYGTTPAREPKAIRTAGSTADDRSSDLLIELKAQFYKLVTL